MDNISRLEDALSRFSKTLHPTKPISIFVLPLLKSVNNRLAPLASKNPNLLAYKDLLLALEEEEQ